MENIISAIIHLVEHPKLLLGAQNTQSNVMNAHGEALEGYIRDLFAGTLGLEEREVILDAYEQTFSYLGNQNNPPDMLLRGGDAIEVKKLKGAIGTIGALSIALNSSYPKDKLSASNPRINNACRTCEIWETRDMLYAVGVLDGRRLHTLALVYGSLFCAEAECYERIEHSIKEAVNTTPDVILSETRELGKVHKVDPLGITDLRVRGMWHIKNPLRHFADIYTRTPGRTFELCALIPKNKYDTFEHRNKLIALAKQEPLLSIDDCKVPDPNNPARRIDVVRIIYGIDK